MLRIIRARITHHRRSRAAKKGWETRERNQRAAAARKGWESRRQMAN